MPPTRRRTRTAPAQARAPRLPSATVRARRPEPRRRRRRRPRGARAPRRTGNAGSLAFDERRRDGLECVPRGLAVLVLLGGEQRRRGVEGLLLRGLRDDDEA